ncbi:MAG TPA: MFS transporter [Aggregatilineaceae bacterium]|nr:MFS transporter [Aggregatilineaceae bacterium]
MNNRRLVTLTCFIAFIVMGVTTAILGPTLSYLAAALALPLASAGILRAAQQIGGISAPLGGGRLLDRHGPRYILLPGLLLMAVGLLSLIASGNVIFGFVASVLLGIGTGLVNLGGNVTIGALYESNAAPVLAALHTCYGLGLFGGPLVAEWALTRQGNWQAAYVVTAVLCAGLGLLFIRLPVTIRASTSTRGDEPPRSRPAILWLPLLPLLLLLFMYNGAGSGMSDWLPTHLQLVAHSGVDAAAQVTSLYGLSLTIGRILSIGALRQFGNMRVLAVAIGVAVVGAGLITFGGAQIGLVTVGVVMVGLGFAPIYPTVIAIGGQQQPENRGSVVGILAGLASIGGIIIPVVQGWVGAGQSGGMIVILVSALVMAAALTLVRTFSAQKYQAA